MTTSNSFAHYWPSADYNCNNVRGRQTHLASDTDGRRYSMDWLALFLDTPQSRRIIIQKANTYLDLLCRICDVNPSPTISVLLLLIMDERHMLYIYTHTNTHTQTHTHTHTHMCMCVCVFVCVYTAITQYRTFVQVGHQGRFVKFDQYSSCMHVKTSFSMVFAIVLPCL